MSLVAVQLYWLERAENPGFEAVCDVFSGFGATASEALDALATAIEAGPPQPDPTALTLVEQPAAPVAVDYDKLADAIYQRITSPASPAAPAEAPPQQQGPAAS